jgi:hypothetical protein
VARWFNGLFVLSGKCGLVVGCFKIIAKVGEETDDPADFVQGMSGM